MTPSRVLYVVIAVAVFALSVAVWIAKVRAVARERRGGAQPGATQGRAADQDPRKSRGTEATAGDGDRRGVGSDRIAP